jgi:apocytochrome f
VKYPIYVGGNRGRGQVYPDGSKSNNTVFNASVGGRIRQIQPTQQGGVEVLIETNGGEEVVEKIPPGPSLIVNVDQTIQADQPLTTNPNVGGFGQKDTEIVLQSPARVEGLLLFFSFVVLTQVFLVLKKKQFEKVQLAEMNF